MIKKRKNDVSVSFHTVCIAIVWITVFYSSIIQQKFIQIPNGMMILGFAILLTFGLAHGKQLFESKLLFTEEIKLLMIFMIYMLLIGFLFSPDLISHLSQWITCLEYMFLLIVISALIKSSGTESFHILLLVEAVVLVIFFLFKPVAYGGNRFSISLSMNPNGLGMNFAAGIWAVFLQQQKKRIPLVLACFIITLLGYGIVLTGSRKALIAAGIIIILWVLLCFLPSLREEGLRGLISFVALIVVFILIERFFMSVYSNSVLADRMSKLLFETTEGERSNMYRAGFEMLKSNPLFGLGFQGFKHENGSMYSHATLVEIPVSGGIIGSLIYFAAYFVSIRRTIRLFKATKGLPDLIDEHNQIKMLIILWIVMLFYATCIIHQYQFDSFIIFGLIFGETSYIEKYRLEKTCIPEKKTIRYRYIKT